MENGNPWKIPFDPVKCGATFGVAILKHLKPSAIVRPELAHHPV
jgi:hypothetical protein